MEKQHYKTSIEIPATPETAYLLIADVSGWWAKDFNGRAVADGDRFRVTFGTTWVDFIVKNAIAGKTVTWHVADCHLPWLEHKTEWTGTDVVWNITQSDSGTRIEMTHVGLFPAIECYETCRSGWNRHINESLQSLANTGKGMPA